jgi:hypothetical protein
MDTAGFAHLFRSVVLPQSGLTPAERSNFHVKWIPSKINEIKTLFYSDLICILSHQSPPTHNATPMLGSVFLKLLQLFVVFGMIISPKFAIRPK